jgi:hypothetical protein
MWMNCIPKTVALPLAFLCLAGAADSQPRLTFEGLGPVRIGMSETELKKIGFSDPYRSSDWQTDDEYPACHYLANEEDYPGVGLMINDNRLVRIDVGAKAASAKWQTLSGATIGMTETEIAAIYGSWMKMDYHPYLGDSGSYLTLQSGDGRYRMIFETATPDGSGEAFVSSPSRGPNSRKRVTNFRAGLAEPVGYIEGCS